MVINAILLVQLEIEVMILSKLHKDEFSQRQTMIRSDFECFHYLDSFPPNVEFHEHEFYEVFFFLSGNVSYNIEGRTYLLRPGDILLTDNQDIHRPEVRPGKPYERYVVWITPSFLVELEKHGPRLTDCFKDASQKDYKLIRPDGKAVAHLKSILDKIVDCRESTEFGSSTLEFIYLCEFMVFLNRAYFATPDMISKDITENEKINKVVSYINDNLEENLTLGRLAEVCFISKSYLSHQFKEYTGLTVFQFIIKKRLTAARNMIREGIPVIEACMRCGFNDYSNFHKAFRKEFGSSPKAFRPNK